MPINRALGDIFRHALHLVVKRPAVVAVEVAFPLGEEIRDDGVELARQDARFDVRKEPSPHAAVNQRGWPAPFVRICGRTVFVLWKPFVGEQLRVHGESGSGKLLRILGRWWWS